MKPPAPTNVAVWTSCNSNAFAPFPRWKVKKALTRDVEGVFVRRRLTGLALATAMGLVSATPAGAVDGRAIGDRYNDGLDTRLSATKLSQMLGRLGYTSSARTSGTDATTAWRDGAAAGVFGFFGHADAGGIQTGEGSPDPILVAGQDTHVVSVYDGVRFMSEYLPFTDVDDMRLMILAGCNTAKANPTLGDLRSMPVKRGVDSVVTFVEKVYFPDTPAGTAATETNYSGNYFWSRFAYHIEQGVTVNTALGRALTDLVSKEGNNGGWDSYYVTGSVAKPGAIRLTPAAAGQPATTQPTPAFAAVSELTPTSSTSQQGANTSTSVRSVETAEGVSYRRDATTGALIDLVGVASSSGNETLTQAQAIESALAFAQREMNTTLDTWRIHASPISHAPTDELTRVSVTPPATETAQALSMEVDRRTGAIVYYSHAQPVTEDTSTAQIDQASAIEIARATVGLGDQELDSVVSDHWGQARWTVTLRDQAQPMDWMNAAPTHQVVIDAVTGAVLSVSST